MLQLDVTPQTKEIGLRAFQRRGWLLVDATYEPVNKLKKRERDEVIRRDYALLHTELLRLIANRAVPLILVKENVCRLLDPLLRRDGFKVLNDGLVYFPSHSRQLEFKRQFKAALAKIA
jgi:hypothetical protein